MFSEPALKRTPEFFSRCFRVALPATVDGQTTAHYIAERIEARGARVSTLGQGVPVGGELDYLDDGTIGAALRARRAF